jgi:hypothetical protein
VWYALFMMLGALPIRNEKDPFFRRFPIGSLLVQENGLDYASGGASLSANFEV